MGAKGRKTPRRRPGLRKRDASVNAVFDSPDGAAMRFLMEYQGVSQREKKEYGAVIYRCHGKYLLGPTHVGGRNGVIRIFWEALNPIHRGRVAGTIHTHPEEIPRAFGTDSAGNSFSGMDAMLRGTRYLGAPNGAAYKNKKHNESNVIVARGLPKAENSVKAAQVFCNTPFWAELRFRAKLAAKRMIRRKKK